MTDITSALWRFWSQFEMDGEPIPVYQSGVVPDDAEYPYITFDPAQADAMNTLPLSATLWVRYANGNSASAIAQRTAFMGAVRRALPPGGVILRLDVGYMVLRRGSGDFLSALSDENDRNVLGGRVGYEVTYCTI